MVPPPGDRDAVLTPEAARLGVLKRVQGALALSCAALLEQESGSWRFVAFEGRCPHAHARGARVSDLGAAAPAVSSGRPLLLNPDAPRPLRVPVSSTPRVVAGAAAIPLSGGLAWVDREDRPINPVELESVVAAFAAADEAARIAARLRESEAQVRRLGDTLEGVRAVLASADQQESVTALAEATLRHIGARTVLVILTGAEPGTATIAAGAGAAARPLVGRSIEPVGLIDLALRTGSAVPVGGRYQPVMGPVPAPTAALGFAPGDALLVQPLGSAAEPLGVLVLAGGTVDDPPALHGVRTLCETTALLLQQLRLREQVRMDSMTDGLTALYNRRAFLEMLAQTTAICERHGTELAVLMIDADHFKRVNDQHGHPVGDRVLRYIADTVRKALRGSDFAGRYGGEEFVVALPHTGLEGARIVAERIREACGASPVPVGTTRIPVTVSVGASCLRPGSARPDELIRVADECLYEAKRSGRNRVVVR